MVILNTLFNMNKLLNLLQLISNYGTNGIINVFAATRRYTYVVSGWASRVVRPGPLTNYCSDETRSERTC